MKDDLQYWRELWFGWLLVSTATVGVGLALEGPELWFVIRDTLRSRRDRRRFFVTWPTHPPDWMTVLAFAGWTLIVLGVMGEGAIEAVVSKADGNIQTFNGILLNDATKETALAFERAAHAEMTARGFESQIAASTATAKSADARTAKAELELAKITQPRRLTPEQQKRIAAKLKSFPGMQFDLALTNLPEPAEFSLTIENTLAMGGWTEIDWKGGDIVSTRPSGRTTGFVTATGVFVQMHKEQVAKFWGAATALAEALKAEGIDATAQPGVGPKNDNNNAIHVLIGEKPKE